MSAQPAGFAAFPDQDYRFTLGISRCDPAEFFAASPDSAEILAERRHWLNSSPANYVTLSPEGERAALEFCRLARPWITATEETVPDTPPLEQFMRASMGLEPDVVLVDDRATPHPLTVGGVVCFPSGWSLPERLGETVEEIHAVVPGLNVSLGRNIDRFLRSLKPGQGWKRSNWGAAASCERNQHPCRELPTLSLPISPEHVWLRQEHQLLFRLPQTEVILFAIRLEHTSLAAVCENPSLAQRWERGLRTMPAELLRYKRLDQVRDAILEVLTAAIH